MPTFAKALVSPLKVSKTSEVHTTMLCAYKGSAHQYALCLLRFQNQIWPGLSARQEHACNTKDCQRSTDFANLGDLRHAYMLAVQLRLYVPRGRCCCLTSILVIDDDDDDDDNNTDDVTCSQTVIFLQGWLMGISLMCVHANSLVGMSAGAKWCRLPDQSRQLWGALGKHQTQVTKLRLFGFHTMLFFGCQASMPLAGMDRLKTIACTATEIHQSALR